MNLKTACAVMVTLMPELELDLVGELAFVEEGESLPLHLVAGNVLVPAIERADATDNIEFLRRAFRFAEDLAGSEDEELQNIAYISIVEALGDSLLERRWELLGCCFKKMVEDLRAFREDATYPGEESVSS